MALKHFSHEHPLIFIKDETIYDEDGKIQCCDACVKPKVSITPSYSCPECRFYLHKSCAEMPRQKIHPIHPEHPLTLLPKPNYKSSLCYCDYCSRSWRNFTYNCSLCDFDLDIECASMMDHSFDHPSHHHPLTHMRSPVLCLCHACDTEHKGFFYLCNTCPFMIHHDCLTLPYRFDCTDHPEHPLALAYKVPSEYSCFYNYCEICTKEVKDDYASYYCGECRYFVHINCGTKSYEPFMSILHPWSRAEWTKFKVDVNRPGLIQLPVSDDTVCLINHFMQGLKQAEKPTEDPFIHFSHCHPLTLLNKDEDDDENKLIFEGKCCHLHNKKTDRLLCSACIKPIITTLTPFYRCIEKCGFFLHTSCADLPSQIKHLGHQHPLFLLPVSPTPFGLFECRGCGIVCNGFVYNCPDCDDYKLDVTCGSLPLSIQHEFHKEHILALRPHLSTRCRVTDLTVEEASSRGYRFAYHCESCDFEVLSPCIEMPRKFRHRYDEEHPYILTVGPVIGTDHQPGRQYLCDICERQLNPKHWFYHCIDCDHSLQMACTSLIDYWSRLKFGGTYTITSHPHPLTFVPVIEPNTFFHRFPHAITCDTKCDTAGTCIRVGGLSPMFKCIECNFKIHWRCALLSRDSFDLPYSNA